MKLRKLASLLIVIGMVVMASESGYAQCGSIDQNLTINLPYIEVIGQTYALTLDYYVNPEDPSGFYWQLGSLLSSPGEGISAIVDDSLNIDIPCIDVDGTKYRVILAYSVISSEPAGYYWKFSSIFPSMELTSSAFQYGDYIPTLYTCDSMGISPPLSISEIPAGTVSLALILDDPDAPSGDWVHWLVWNIDPGTTAIPQDSVPAGAIQGKTSSGAQSYGPPCPPSGTHRYFFKLYALDTSISLPASSGKTQLVSAMQGHIITSAELMGLYQ